MSCFRIDSRCQFEIIMLGNAAVGKTSLLMRLDDTNAQTLPMPEATEGADYKVKTIILANVYITLNICDTSGQERFKQLLSTYYSKCAGVVVVYDIQDRQSFEGAKEWVLELRREASPDMVIGLLGNKADMITNRSISTAEAEEYAKNNDLIFMETSSVTALNVLFAFKALGMALKNKKTEREKKLAAV